MALPCHEGNPAPDHDIAGDVPTSVDCDASRSRPGRLYPCMAPCGQLEMAKLNGIGISLVDRQDVLALRHAVGREAKLAGLEGNTTGKLATDRESRGRTDDNQGVVPPG